MKRNLILPLALYAACTLTCLAAEKLDDKLRPKDQPGTPVTSPKAESQGLSGALVLEGEGGFKKIFNGNDLSGWDGNRELWSVQDGAIVGQTTAENPLKGNTFLIWTNGTTTDFELRFSYRITSQNEKGFANSGVQYRSKVLDPAGWVVGGYQADFEAGTTYSGILYEERMTRGIMAQRGEKVVWDADCKKQITGSVGKSEEIQAAIKKNDWNDYVIIAKGNHLQHFINGLPTVDVTDECEAKAAQSGVLALQVHAGPPMKVEFKNIRIKTGPSSAMNEDIRKMQGEWEITSSEVNGAPMPADESKGLVVAIAENKYTVTKTEKIDEGDFSVDISKSPRQMDIHPQVGPNAGRTIPAIYEMSADTLRVCYATARGKERPTDFKTAPDSGQLLINYQRKK